MLGIQLLITAGDDKDDEREMKKNDTTMMHVMVMVVMTMTTPTLVIHGSSCHLLLICGNAGAEAQVDFPLLCIALLRESVEIWYRATPSLVPIFIAGKSGASTSSEQIPLVGH